MSWHETLFVDRFDLWDVLTAFQAGWWVGGAAGVFLAGEVLLKRRR